MSSSARIKKILLDALDRSAGEREAFLARACSGDDELRERVEGLLEAHAQAEDVLGKDSASVPLAASGAGEPPIDLECGDRVGPYVLDELLGSGGFGVVYRATQEEPVRRQVALKVVKLGMDTKAVIARFELERQVLALMEHPSIARVFDAGVTDGGRPYFVMELIDGVPITEYCDREGLGLEARIDLFVRTAKAVHHAHQRGVLHRDIKPSNVMVTVVDGEPQPKVIDFGIAKATGERLTEASFETHAGLLLGTPTYMSPEQAEGALDVDTRTDVYSLGVVLYELISGVPPFDTREVALAAVLETIREETPPRPSTRRRKANETGQTRGRETSLFLDVPPELDWIVMRCLEKERDRRYATAHDLAADAQRFLDDDPLEAAPPSRWYTARKLLHRHRTIALAGAGVVLALLLGTVGTSIGLLRAERMNVRLDSALADATSANEQLDLTLDAMEVVNADLDRSLTETERSNQRLDLALFEAKRQAAIAEAVNEFLTEDLLGAARPTGEQGKGPALSIGELLRIAGRELDDESMPGGRFADKPLVEAALRFTIGITFDTLGVALEASRHMERCVELRDEVLGPDHEERLVALSHLGTIRRREGAYAVAVDMQSEAFELLERGLGLDHVHTLRSAARLSSALREVGRTDEAFDLLEMVVPRARESQGDRSPVVTDLGAALAILYADKGRYAEAEEQFRVVLDAQLELLGPDSPVVLNSKMNIATLTRALGRYGDSEELYRQVLDVQRRVEGPEHPHTLTTLFNLVECLRSVERLDEAREIMEASMPVVERVLGPTHRRTLLWLSTQARLWVQIGNAPEAVLVYRDVLDRARTTIGPADPTTLEAATELAEVLALDQESWAEARELLDEVLDIYTRDRGVEDPATLRAGTVLGAFLETVGDLDGARARLEAVHETSLESVGPAHRLTTESGAVLAVVHAKLGALEEAEALLEQSSSLVESQPGSGAGTWARAARELAEAHGRAGNSDRAARWEQAASDRMGATEDGR